MLGQGRYAPSGSNNQRWLLRGVPDLFTTELRRISLPSLEGRKYSPFFSLLIEEVNFFDEKLVRHTEEVEGSLPMIECLGYTLLCKRRHDLVTRFCRMDFV